MCDDQIENLITNCQQKL